ncbi:hypothetical protein BKA62DRAFT_740324 [Auriculariales sp. MPI-PUGE-AT-0066]|nr:hypothetical protein BKA62DRAFT_740324 [Auriculariales sp. MPI-PUGE-AT-0066]
MNDKLTRRGLSRKKRCAAPDTGSNSTSPTTQPTPTPASDTKPEKETDAPESETSSKTTKTKTSTSTADKPAETDDDKDEDDNSTSTLSKGLRILFPASASSNRALSWSTNSKAPNAVAFTLDNLGIQNDKKNLKHPIETAPDGSRAMEVSFKKGAYDFKGATGGFSFVAYGPDSVDLTKAKEATFAYSAWFEEGFDFNRGGKLPGLQGGDTDEASKRCSGGRKSLDCFSARMMFRKEGRGELYAYLPPGLKGNNGVCDIPPQSDCNPDYGSSLGRGAFYWKTGGWTTMAQRVKLNDVGKNNGEMEIFVNGESVIKATGLTLRRNSNGRIRSTVMQSFFGGHEPEWASPKDQKIWFKDLSVAITEQL